MIYIWAPYHNPRLEYILRYIFTQRLEIDWKLIHNVSEIPSGEPTIFYSEKSRSDFCIYDSGLLNENKIRNFEPELRITEEKIELFPAIDSSFTLDFDVFSAVFYFLSRYEEYLNYESDIHGRFDTLNSFAFKHSFHQRALVDEYILYFRALLKNAFPDLHLKNDSFDYRITVDVDMVFSYKGKGFLRNSGGAIRDLLNGRFAAYLKRYLVLLGLHQDPYYTFDKLDALNAKSAYPLRYFVLFADKRSQYDKNISRNHEKTRKILKKLSAKNPLGLHPSYSGHANVQIHKEEKLALENLCGLEINSCRQHYLKMTLPETYERLYEMGFTEDYTMGFASIPGYRASTSRPFPFFNLSKNESLDFMIHPFSVMDGSYKDYNEQSTDNVLDALCRDIDYLQQIGGRFCILIHNETLSESKRWKGWSTMLEKLLNYLNNKAI